MGVRMTVGEYKVLPEGRYPGKFVDYLEKPPGQYGPFFELTFQIVAESGKGEGLESFTLRGRASKSLAPLAKLYRWITALGAKLEPGKVVDLDNYIGSSGLLEIKHTTDPKGNTYANVVDVYPLPTGMKVPDMVPAPVQPSVKAPQAAQKATQATSKNFTNTADPSPKPGETIISDEEIPF